MDGHIAKPINIRELFEVLERVSDREQAVEGPAASQGLDPLP
jgi:hypothetical protein